MSQTISADHLLDTRGVRADFGAFVVAAAFDRGGLPAFALGDGTLRLPQEGAWRSIAAHEGGVLALASDVTKEGFVSGGDDGRFLRVARDGTVTELAGFGMKWVEHVASFADAKSSVLACAVGKHAHLFDAGGSKLKSLVHPSTVSGITFDARGKRIGASHYNGASLWFVASKSDNPRLLEWKGSHTAIAISPDGESLVTAMQENALHGWRLSDGQHMRMSGYPSKTASLGFTRSGKWLATSGAEAVVVWPFFGGGPMGKAPTELAGADGVFCTRIACHPQHEAVAAGFTDGMVLLADIQTQRLLPVAGPGRGPVSALAWRADGTLLAFGTETGFAAVVDFSQRT
jgi:WD40 repeat protein